VAVLPAVPWEARTEAERQRICATPEAELQVTQDLRQRLFDSHSSTDDHLMHLVGLARDQHGTKAEGSRTGGALPPQASPTAGNLAG
jgi:bleomycin hydrolase